MADGIVFWLYLGTILADQREIWNRDEGSHADVVHVTKTAIFANSRWRMAAILKIALSQYLSRELSDFDQICYTDTNFHSKHENLKKYEIFEIQDGGRTPYWKSFFAISWHFIGRLTWNSEWRWWITWQKKLVPWGTDGRLPLNDLDLDLGSGHTAYRRASLINLYLRTKFDWDRKKIFFESHHWGFGQVQSHVTKKLG